MEESMTHRGRSVGNSQTQFRIQLSTEARSNIDAYIHHTLDLGEVASPDVGCDTGSLSIAAPLALETHRRPVRCWGSHYRGRLCLSRSVSMYATSWLSPS